MQRFVLGVALAIGLAGAASATPSKLWEVTGLDTPESVVFDAASNALYVSSIGGEIMAKDQNGFISKVSPDGQMIERGWVTGLDGLTGLALSNGKLFAADINQLVEIDIAAAKVVKRYKVQGARFLNDAASDKDGTIYVSDSFTDTIWRLKDGRFEPWLTEKTLNGPNGLLVESDRLIVAPFGVLPEGDKKEVLGELLEVPLGTKTVRKLGSGPAIGHLDGLQQLAPGSYLVGDWIAGAIYRVAAEGGVTKLLQLGQGTADFTYLPDTKTVIIPMMKDNALFAYKLD